MAPVGVRREKKHQKRAEGGCWGVIENNNRGVGVIHHPKERTMGGWMLKVTIVSLYYFKTKFYFSVTKSCGTDSTFYYDRFRFYLICLKICFHSKLY